MATSNRKKHGRRPIPVAPSRPAAYVSLVGASLPRGDGHWYNTYMAAQVFEDLVQYVGFDERDASNLVALRPHVQPHIPHIVDQFYKMVSSTEGTRAVISDEEQLGRLRGTLSDWMTELFCGRYDHEYYRKRAMIGYVHVRVGLPQRYMIAAMELVSWEFKQAVRGSDVRHPERMLDSLQKLLTIELGVMLENYKDSYAAEIRDSERNTYVEKLTRAEHLAHIGELAASLAHEVKNALAGISGAIQVLERDLPPEHPFNEVREEMLAQIDRVDATVKDLLVYARPKSPELTRTRVGEVLQRGLVLLRGVPAFLDVEVATAGLDSDAQANIDEAQIQQLFSNLMLNAAHASGRPGRIRCELSVEQSTVCVSVEDSGAGMSREVASRAFEPFFTTKARGTGLGLSICKRIVEAHGGTISIRSEVGCGTSVRVELPRAL